MAANRRVPDVDFGNDPNDASASQRAALQNTQPIIYPFPQLSGEGTTAFHTNDTACPSPRCMCGAKFSRSDALARHIKAKSNGIPEHPCNNCDRYQGMNGFHRRDHLVQHMRYCRGRNVENEPRDHRAEPLPAAMVPGPSMPMNEDAIPSDQLPPFACTDPECDKWGMNGYLRLQDLIEHQGWAHPFMSQAQGSMPQFEGNMQPYQPIHDLQPDQANNALQVYQLYNTSQGNQQDAAFMFFQPVVAPQPFQPINAHQFWGQDGASQFLQPGDAPQPPQSETYSQHHHLEDVFQFDQQDGTSPFPF
ncbi:uncharacterized protein F4807DRAFT_456028 [Annulohypoxylon truncatum]|uniref:uncharacterized protein n=1 Tax=Annulohypoxylon truncatum TaxID=327061 RepID=UPI002008CAF1|nr:uncharacterized protein F4807DRAFT_456028 [Annulohypoxylon truncatum]KAI1214391.1 hypothetical protein F4807DRAFT_456028 [Annulohypoxylon truncatum]